jgi:putative nucleotidyltransferase with HDIG domain
MDRDTAWQTVTEHVEHPGLRNHMQAVEVVMRSYAAKLGEDPDEWGLAGLLHDYDWEIHPTSEQHPVEGIPLLRERGCPEPVLGAILSHNPAGSGVKPSTSMGYALRACDEITGLITAAALVRPSKDVRDVKLKSVKKRFKEKAFARGVDREEVVEATEEFSRECFGGELELWDHVAHVLEVMQAEAEKLELDGRLAEG